MIPNVLKAHGRTCRRYFGFCYLGVGHIKHTYVWLVHACAVWAFGVVNIIICSCVCVCVCVCVRVCVRTYLHKLICSTGYPKKCLPLEEEALYFLTILPVARLQMKVGHMDGMHCFIDRTSILVKIKSLLLHNCRTVYFPCVSLKCPCYLKNISSSL